MENKAENLSAEASVPSVSKIKWNSAMRSNVGEWRKFFKSY